MYSFNNDSAGFNLHPACVCVGVWVCKAGRQIQRSGTTCHRIKYCVLCPLAHRCCREQWARGNPLVEPDYLLALKLIECMTERREGEKEGRRICCSTAMEGRRRRCINLSGCFWWWWLCFSICWRPPILIPFLVVLSCTAVFVLFPLQPSSSFHPFHRCFLRSVHEADGAHVSESALLFLICSRCGSHSRHSSL